MSLADARLAANRALRKVDAGTDPQADKRAAKRAAVEEKLAAERAKRDSIEALCTAYIKHAETRKRTWRDDQSKIRCEILPAWKGRPVSSITRRDCRVLVQGIADRPAPIYANRIVALLSRLFRFAVDEELIAANIAAQLPKPGVEAGSATRLAEREQKPFSEDEIRAIWKATESLDPAPRALYRLGLLTGQRPGEIGGMTWDEIEGEWWTVPGSRAKNGRTHRVYLTAEALKALMDVPRVEGEVRVFAGFRGKRQIAELNAKVFAGLRRRVKPRHALRDTVATGMATVGVAVSNISRVLNHSLDLAVTMGYMHYSFDAEKEIALEAWGRELARILAGEEKSQASVVPFGDARR